MRLALAAILLAVSTASAGLEQYSALLVADQAGVDRPPQGGIRITYLGTNGYQFEAQGHTLLVDPYFTRANLCAVGFNQRIDSEDRPVSAALLQLRPRADAVLVTHAHFDHLLDVPAVMRRTGARLVAGATAVNLVRSLGISEARCRSVQPGDLRRIGPWKIRVLEANHDRFLGTSPPIPGTRSAPGDPPVKPSDWVLGEPLAFVVEAAGLKIYIDSGGLPGILPPEENVDLAILGAALPDSRKRLPATIRRLHPRYVLPSHQDDFFQPLDRGFEFGKLTDMGQIRRLFDAQNERLPGRLILLDYFRPWTLR